MVTRNLEPLDIFWYQAITSLFPLAPSLSPLLSFLTLATEGGKVGGGKEGV